MVQRYYAPMRNRYAKNKNFPVESYKEFEWDGKTFLKTYVTDFYDHWIDAYAYGGAIHHAGITRLIHTLPTPWSEWTAQAAEPYTWYNPPEYEPLGDMIVLMGVLLLAMAAAIDGPPLRPPAHKIPPGQVRRWKYRYDEEPHVSRVPRRSRLRMRTSPPLRIESEVEEMLVITPPPSNTEEEDEEAEPLEEERDSAMESVGENEEPEEDENGDNQK